MLKGPFSSLEFKGLHYERRIVFFFDIWGWRAHVGEAGNDPQCVAKLAAVLRLFSQTLVSQVEHMKGANLSSFSDNVVVSLPYYPDLVLPRLEALASILCGAACMGFFFRGGVTIGDLFHDKDIVFGPALNRAYDLESQEAVYPRTILDPGIAEFGSMSSDFLCTEGKNTFLDPFTNLFIARRLQYGPDTQTLKVLWAEQTGLKTNIDLATTPQQMLHGIFLIIHFQMEKASQGSKKKYYWLYERIGRRIGVL